MGKVPWNITVIDATFATPILFRPVEHGFDIEVHSATKGLNGHGDIVLVLWRATASGSIPFVAVSIYWEAIWMPMRAAVSGFENPR